MGVPDSGLHAAEQSTAEGLLTAFRTIKPAERARHASVLDYWLSIRGDKEFPPLHDLDPLEISDAGASSVLLELISGGQDAEIRHLGDSLKGEGAVQQIIDAPNPSILCSIAKKLPIVAISRDFLAFEDSFGSGTETTRCWVTLLPLSSCGSWVDYVYAFVSVETLGGKSAKAPEVQAAAVDEKVVETDVAAPEVPVDTPEVTDNVAPQAAEEAEAKAEGPAEPVEAQVDRDEPEGAVPMEEPAAKGGPGFSKLLEGFANLAGFYGQGVKTETVVPTMELTEAEPPADELVAIDPADVEPEAVEPQTIEPETVEPLAIEPEELEPEAAEPEVMEPEAVEPPAEVEELVLEPAPVEQPEQVEPKPVLEPTASEAAPAMEGALESKLTDVRAKADEARMAQLRATAALHEGLSAAYDFALDAETSPEEYLRLVEAQGMKIQLRAPMAPVVKLAFNGLADDTTIADLETILAWALKQELPRGSLAERIEQAGGIDGLLNQVSRPS